MASNKNALIRYKTLDKCFKNQFKNYTLEDLIEECSEALFEFEGKESFVSKRTIQLDIQLMRSDKLGFEAPIEVYDKKYYRYSDPDYSIYKIDINQNDMKILNDAVQILKQFKDFSMFENFNGLVQKLENSLLHNKQRTIIHLDKNDHLKGLEHLDFLFNSIVKRQTLQIKYRSFKAREENKFVFYPYLLKEYNNRWFLIGFKGENLQTLALDRIISVEKTDLPFKNKPFSADEIFQHIIGVTFAANAPLHDVVFSVRGINSQYVITKPFHHSQKVLYKKENEIYFSIKVQLNFELERLILGFGDSITIHQPEHLRKRIHFMLKKAVENYEKE